MKQLEKQIKKQEARLAEVTARFNDHVNGKFLEFQKQIEAKLKTAMESMATKSQLDRMEAMITSLAQSQIHSGPIPPVRDKAPIRFEDMPAERSPVMLNSGNASRIHTDGEFTTAARDRGFRPQWFTQPKLELPMYEGEGNPRTWIRKCEKFFLSHQVAKHWKVEHIELYLEGKAEIWFQATKMLKLQLSWVEFKNGLIRSGLKEEIKPMVRMLPHQDLNEVFDIALLQEQNMSVNAKAGRINHSTPAKTYISSVKVPEHPKPPVKKENCDENSLSIPELNVDDGLDINDLTLDERSLHVLSVTPVKQTILIVGKIGGRFIRILIDTGNTDSFLDIKVVMDLQLHYEESELYTVTVGNGSRVSRSLICPELRWDIHDLKFSYDLKIMN
ncbi:OLC1v1025690C1 [Oldenlandia corymbosa var. corymbosa]|uniref:OLC1v1025690C1 n=1 Tax=Oldenlandia corymbosa var. corymbosa TaxID=529605 RepID=A0AAV1C5H3_OLDCO|nr:OLC1v1025690C1 [Oldenlandia corymbosa var. corymbosa]